MYTLWWSTNITSNFGNRIQIDMLTKAFNLWTVARIVDIPLLLVYHGKNVLDAISTNGNDDGPIPNRVYHDGHVYDDRDVMIGVQHVLKVSRLIMLYRHRVLVLQYIHAMPTNETIVPNIRTTKQ